MNASKPFSTQVMMDTLDDLKAQDITLLDVRSLCNFTDWMLIATARSTRHAAAVAEKIALDVKEQTAQLPKIEGKDTGEWVLVDCNDVIIHVMIQEQRERYALEKIWSA